MPIVQISKLQHRTGADTDLPQLDIGELGYATNTQQLFIGDDNTISNNPTEHNNSFVTEILTEHSNIASEKLVGTANLSHFKIAGGSGGQFLRTDGAGNLTWYSVSGGGGGSSVASGGTGYIQLSTGSGTFDSSANLTFNSTIKTLTVDNVLTGNIGASGNISGRTVSGDGRGLSNLAGANVTGFVANANVANLAYKVSGANVTGAVALASLANAVAGANVTGQVANALVAGTVLTGAQPNITSVGTLVSLAVTANVSAVNFTGTNFTGNFNGNGATLTNLNAANVVGAISSATFATSSGTAAVANLVTGANVSGQVSNALVAGTVYSSAQPNITSVGTLANLTSTGNVTSQYFIGSGTYLTGVFGPAFTAVQTAYQSLVACDVLTTLALVYNSLVSHVGNDYNSTTGVFTATTPGWYNVSASIGVCPYASHGSTGAGSVVIYKNSTAIAGGNFTGTYAIPGISQVITVADTSSVSTSVLLAAGDTLHCKILYVASSDLWTTQSQAPSIFQAVWIRP